jgi:hypothetical protein
MRASIRLIHAGQLSRRDAHALDRKPARQLGCGLIGYEKPPLSPRSSRPTAWLGRQDSKLCIPNDRHRTQAAPVEGIMVAP